MTATESTMPKLGSAAPWFELPEPATDRRVKLSDFDAAPALLVAFICNHCPYVKHIRGKFLAFAAEYQPRGLAVVGISSNDALSHPEDAPAAIAYAVREHVFTFPYLYDESQQVATAYRAACTPDFFLYDRDRRLYYRGQFDAARPGNGKPVTGDDLRAAVDAVLAGRPAPEVQRPSIGCNIKWKPGNEPAWTGQRAP